tara:strand:- start:2975 stop:3121 length:147 start_codon:yes stop_codon:yes gene_type:complete
MRYLLEFKWGLENPVVESLEIETEDIAESIDQIQRHRGHFHLLKCEKQ